MIEKVSYKAKLSEHNEQKQNLEYWLSRTPEERVEAVEYLRQMFYGQGLRLNKKVVRIINRATGEIKWESEEAKRLREADLKELGKNKGQKFRKIYTTLKRRVSHENLSYSTPAGCRHHRPGAADP